MGCLFFGFLIVVVVGLIHTANVAHIDPLLLIGALILMVVFKRSARL